MGCGARGQYLNRPSFRENRCGSPSGDTRHASRPAADHVHPWDSLVGSETRVRLDQGASIARVKPRAPFRVRSPTLLTAFTPPAVNSCMGRASVVTLSARVALSDPIKSSVAPISKITVCPSGLSTVLVLPTPLCVVSMVKGLSGCSCPMWPLLWACILLLTSCSAASLPELLW